MLYAKRCFYMHLLKSSSALCMLIAAPVFANPIGGQVAAGTAHIQYGATTVITQTTNRAVINWKDFSVGANETTRFKTLGSNAVTLNRVVGGNPSTIMGKLSSNGQIFLVNPNGIIFGNTARVDVAGLVATTANISNTDFMSGNYHFTNAPAGSYVINKGTITVRKAGLAALVAPNVRNSGTIQANLGKVALSSGTAFTLDLYGDNLIAFDASSIVNAGYVENLGRIEANGGSVMLSVASAENMIENVINTSGYISAQSVGAQNGKILLQGYNNSTVQISGTIDASGDGTGQTGGTIHVFANQIDLFAGNLLKASGNLGGGFIETSGEILNLSAANINASSPRGFAGTWYIDPFDLTIDDAAAATYNGILGAGTANLLVEATNNIYFTNSATPISWSTDVSFTAYAGNTIDFNTGAGIAINSNGSGDITLHANSGTVTFTSGPLDTVNSTSNGDISIFYNPIDYTTPTSFTNIGGFYTAYMLVHDAADLQNINTNLSGDYALSGNIVGTGGTFTPLGDSGTPFEGSFTGNGFSISNLNIVGTTDVGLFGYTSFADTTNVITNVTLLNSTITGTTNVGSIVGYASATTALSNLYSNATVSGVNQVGGIVGYMEPDGPPSDPTPMTTLSNAFFSGTVNGTTNVGGIVGQNSGHIFTSLFVGTLNGTTNVGGVAGNNSGNISDSYSSLNAFSGNAVGTGASDGAFAVIGSMLTSLPGGFDSSLWQTNGASYYISLISCGSSCIIPVVSGGNIPDIEKQYVTTNSILNNNVPKVVPIVPYYFDGSLMYTIPLSTGDGVYVLTVTPETDTKGTVETAIDTLKSAYGCAVSQ